MNTQNGFGVDVALGRTDDLDKLMLEKVSQTAGLDVLDIGCGGGGQSLRLTLAGARVVSLDIKDFSENFAKLREENKLSESQLRFIQTDLRNIEDVLKSQRFDFICLQRVLHYLNYAEAKEALELLKRYTDRLFVAVSGLQSAIGDHYPDKEKVVGVRYCRIDAKGVEKFFITEPVCLYRKEEFEKLLAESGWTINISWQSAFGNIKVVASSSD